MKTRSKQKEVTITKIAVVRLERMKAYKLSPTPTVPSRVANSAERKFDNPEVPLSLNSRRKTLPSEDNSLKEIVRQYPSANLNEITQKWASGIQKFVSISTCRRRLKCLGISIGEPKRRRGKKSKTRKIMPKRKYNNLEDSTKNNEKIFNENSPVMLTENDVLDDKNNAENSSSNNVEVSTRNIPKIEEDSKENSRSIPQPIGATNNVKEELPEKVYSPEDINEIDLPPTTMVEITPEQSLPAPEIRKENLFLNKVRNRQIFKRRSNITSIPLSALSERITAKRDEFEIFGQYITLSLRKMSFEKALKCKEKIFSIIINDRLGTGS